MQDRNTGQCNFRKGFSWPRFTGNRFFKSSEDSGKSLGFQRRSTDIFDFQSLVEFARELSPTKRNIIRIYSKVFDPVGVISPIFVVLKLMF